VADKNDGGLNPGSGFALVYQRISSTDFTVVQRLVPPDPVNDDEFGYRVGLWDDVAIVASFPPNQQHEHYYLYVYLRDHQTGQYNFSEKLVSPSPLTNDWFGQSFVGAGSLLVVGAPGGYDGTIQGGEARGAVYVYRRDEQTGLYGAPTQTLSTSLGL